MRDHRSNLISIVAVCLEEVIGTHVRLWSVIHGYPC